MPRSKLRSSMSVDEVQSIQAVREKVDIETVAMNGRLIKRPKFMREQISPRFRAVGSIETDEVEFDTYIKYVVSKLKSKYTINQFPYDFNYRGHDECSGSSDIWIHDLEDYFETHGCLLDSSSPGSSWEGIWFTINKQLHDFEAYMYFIPNQDYTIPLPINNRSASWELYVYFSSGENLHVAVTTDGVLVTNWSTTNFELSAFSSTKLYTLKLKRKGTTVTAELYENDTLVCSTSSNTYLLENPDTLDSNIDEIDFNCISDYLGTKILKKIDGKYVTLIAEV